MPRKTDIRVRFGEIVGITEENRTWALAEIEVEHHERVAAAAAALQAYAHRLKK